MTPRPDEVMRVTQQLIEAERALKVAKARYNALFGLSGESKPIRQRTHERLEDRLLRLLDDNPHIAYDGDVAAKLLTANSATVKTTLSRMVYKGQIEKRGFSTYGSSGKKYSDAVIDTALSDDTV